MQIRIGFGRSRRPGPTQDNRSIKETTLRTFLASVSLATITLLASFQASAAFTVKIFADPVDTGTDVEFGDQIGEFTSDLIGFTSDNLVTSDPGWPLADRTFGAEVTGYFNTAVEGLYPLYLGSDDGAYLFVNGALVISRPGNQSYGESQADASLMEGSTPFRIVYFNGPCCGSQLTIAADDRVTITSAPIPEPGTYALMAGGLAVLAAGARRRRQREIG